MVFESLRRVFWPSRLFWSSERKVAAFCEGRSRQTDDQFLVDSRLPLESEAARIALAVRRAVASVGTVDPEFIRADDVYPDQLGMLPLWDSLDLVAYIMELEERLETVIPDRDADQLLDDRGMLGISVKEMAARVSRLMTSRRSA